MDRLTKEEIIAAWNEAVPESKDKGIEMYLHLMQAVADAQYRKCALESVRSEAVAWAVTWNGVIVDGNIFGSIEDAGRCKDKLDAGFPHDKREIVPLFLQSHARVAEWRAPADKFYKDHPELAAPEKDVHSTELRK